MIGEAFFPSLVRSLAEALNVRYALISGCIDTPPTRVCTHAFWQGNEFGENIEYDLYGTPCEKVFSGQRLQRLLNQILLYAKPHNLDLVALELHEPLTEMLTALEEMPSASDKKLIFHPDSHPIKVLADRDKLKQVIINLVTNAFEAVEPGEAIALSIQADSANQVCIQVHNGGNPIPPDVLPKLTKPFVTTKSSGTGLGLAIVKRIVEAHGGELSIESSATAGTTITVKLPTR